MIRIGIVGAENSHTAAIAKCLNIEKKVPGCRITAVWGETRKFAHAAAEAGAIPTIVKDPLHMIGQIDAVIVDHRHGKFHLPAAHPFLEAGLPIFVDKPFCCDLKEGMAFLDRAAKLKVPVTSFSVLPKQADFKKLKKELKKCGDPRVLVTTGPCDIKSKYGGIFFYGIHQVGLILEAAGFNITAAEVHKGKTNATATLYYDDGKMVTMNLISEGHASFHVSAIGTKGRFDMPFTFDENIYLSGIRIFTKMFKTGGPCETRESILGPVAVLEALQKSLKNRKKVKVTSF